MTSLAPVPSEQPVCSNCSAPLVADQRYCLSCGQPVSPVRLAFLDVLQTEPQQLPAPTLAAPIAYGPYIDQQAGPAWLRRYAPLFAVASVLLLAMLVGLLLGHWVTQSNKTPSAQVIKIEGLSAAAPAASAAGTTATTPTATKTGSTTTGTSASASKEEKQEEAEAKAEEAAPVKTAPPKKVSGNTVNNLEKSTGKKHQEEINKLGTGPIVVE